MQDGDSFSKNEISNVQCNDDGNIPTKDDLAAFLRSKSRYKTQGAIMIVNLLDKTTASKIKSIMDLLNDIEK